MKQLYGLYYPNGGKNPDQWRRKRIFRSPQDAIDAGVGMIHQHFMLVPSLTVVEKRCPWPEIQPRLPSGPGCS